MWKSKMISDTRQLSSFLKRKKIREIALDMEMSQIGLNSEQTFFREIFFSWLFVHQSGAPRSIEETEFFAETNFLRRHLAPRARRRLATVLRLHDPSLRRFWPNGFLGDERPFGAQMIWHVEILRGTPLEKSFFARGLSLNCRPLNIFFS